MTLTTATRFGDGLPQSGTLEAERVASLTARGWVISSATLGANATQVSNAAYDVIVNGVMLAVAASLGTALWVTGIGTIATGVTGAFVVTVTVSGTHKAYLCPSGTTLNAIALPTASTPGAPNQTVSMTEVPLGIIVIACSAGTAFNGGVNSLADSSYTVTSKNVTGPTGLVLGTEAFSIVPG